MKKEIKLFEQFGKLLADGTRGSTFRITEVEPAISSGHMVVFDFDEVQGMSDSFANALFGEIYILLDGELSGKIKFLNCSPSVRQHLQDTLAFAMKRAKSRQLA